ncbi:MAG TPA: energy transducer TonB [Gemmatimonadaceae bacterium]|nr:energy transducer TonB [Gemmatimonadaceae bacterium]
MPGCPLRADGPRFSISVSNHSGPPVSAAVRDTIARAIAQMWGDQEGPEIRDWPRYVRVMRELNARIPAAPFQRQGEWRVRAGDSAVVLLTYGAAPEPTLAIPEQSLRREFRGWVTSAVERAIAYASSGRVLAPPMPLWLPSVADRTVTLELRFGWSPRPDAAIARFTRQDREPVPRRTNVGPRYPEEYRVENIRGEVITAFIITKDGAVDPGSVRVISTDGELFTNSVLAAIPSFRFDPPVMDCKPWPIAVIQPFNFRLR